VVDFYCASRRLVIEIDGIAHDMGDNPERDRRRDAWLRSEGFEVVRIPATDVLREPAQVAESRALFCSAKPPPTRLRRATSPNGGVSKASPDTAPLGEVAARSADGGGNPGVVA
jgi:hypothetical protein